ncbi:monovalent cation/H+ antiporter subunit E, partial [Halorubrum pallidum]
GDPESEDRTAAAERVLERVSAWAEADLADSDAEGADVAIVTDLIGSDDYLFGPDDYVRVLAEYAANNDVDSVLLDPEYTPVGNTTLLQPLEFALSNTELTVETAPVTRPTRRERLRSEATGIRFAAMFGLSLAFYFVLGDPLYWFDWVTGVASAAIVSITLSRISFDADPALPRTPLRLVRGAIYVPVLLYEIVMANLVVARVILDPRLPIDPTMNRMRVIVGSGLPLMTLANSITLTPGTLTVRARDSDLYVHSLIPWARDGLFDGSLERWTRFVYYGRSSARLPTPRERDDCAILQGPDATEDLPIAATDGGAETGETPVAVGDRSSTPTDESAGDAAEVTDR